MALFFAYYFGQGKFHYQPELFRFFVQTIHRDSRFEVFIQ
jgi:hypothetical protein